MSFELHSALVSNQAIVVVRYILCRIVRSSRPLQSRSGLGPVSPPSRKLLLAADKFFPTELFKFMVSIEFSFYLVKAVGLSTISAASWCICSLSISRKVFLGKSTGASPVLSVSLAYSVGLSQLWGFPGIPDVRYFLIFLVVVESSDMRSGLVLPFRPSACLLGGFFPPVGLPLVFLVLT